MESQELTNQRNVSFGSMLKAVLLKWRYGNAVELRGGLRILGKMPVFKLPGQAKVILGDRVVLNSDFSRTNTALTYRCTLVCGLTGVIEVGDNSMLNGVSVTAYKQVTIGKNCQIASCTMISDTDFHPVDAQVRQREVMGYKIDYNEVNKDAINIGNNVWIGWGSIILKGVHIGDNSIVAAGSVVVSDVPPNVIVAGNPAKVVRQLG